MYKLNTWSRIEEVIKFLHNKVDSQHEKVLKEQIKCMEPKPVGKKVYTPEQMTRAFEYYATSRSLYGRLRKDYKLPSVKALSCLTSKVSQLSDGEFLKNVFAGLKMKQRKVTILIDEVYVKTTLQLHGGSLFGKAVNDPAKLAKAVLSIMIRCPFGGPNFMFKMIPVAKMDASFLYKQIVETIKLIAEAGGKTRVIIVDGNRTNQSFLKKFPTVPGKPWLTTDGIFLLFDFVHLLKSIRNNWLTEKNSELSFEINGSPMTAKWDHLIELHEEENKSRLNDSGTRGLSLLNHVAVRPKPIERQKVSTCLKVFCDETYTALTTHPSLCDREDVSETAEFIRCVTDMWKILNVRSAYKDERHRNPLEAVIESVDDSRLELLLSNAKMFQKMEKPRGGKRSRCLTIDTAQAIHHTLNGLVDLSKHLLTDDHDFVMLGEYSNDPLEKAFSKIRQGSGGTYFISVQQTMEKLRIMKTKLLLQLDPDCVADLKFDAGHHCSKCGYLMDENATYVFDSLECLEDKINIETKMSLVHIAGYVTRKDSAATESDLLDTTTFYFQKYGSYTKLLDRGGLKVPTDDACQWAFFCYIMFNAVKDSICRTSLCNVFMLVSEMNDFGMKKEHGRILANIFMKNYCADVTPKSTKEPSQKVLKLSEKA